LQEDNWPLLTVSKGFFETLAAKVGCSCVTRQGRNTKMLLLDVVVATLGRQPGSMYFGQRLSLKMGEVQSCMASHKRFDAHL
jgi:hypothetical protein